MTCQLKHSRHSSQRSAALKEVGKVGHQTALRGDEEGALRTCTAITTMIVVAS